MEHLFQKISPALKMLQESGVLSDDDAREIAIKLKTTTEKGPSPRLLKRVEVAKYLGVSPITVDRWAKDGKLKKRKVGENTTRFCEKDVINFALRKGVQK